MPRLRRISPIFHHHPKMMTKTTKAFSVNRRGSKMATKNKQKRKELTQRDKEILEDICRFGGMRASDINVLHFPPAFANGKPINHSNLQKRLRILRGEELIDYIEVPSTRAEG